MNKFMNSYNYWDKLFIIPPSIVYNIFLNSIKNILWNCYANKYQEFEVIWIFYAVDHALYAEKEFRKMSEFYLHIVRNFDSSR